MRALISLALVVALSGCGREDPPPVTGGLTTVMDSTTDTIVARVAGVVPDAALKRLVAEMRIAPGAENTSLFTETYEFVVDRRGFVWVYDVPTNSVFLFDSTGKLARRIGRRGGGPGEFQGNRGMLILADGRLAVHDAHNARISFFSPAGDFETSWSIERSIGTLVSDAAGRLYTINAMIPRPAPGATRPRALAGDFPLSLVRMLDGGAVGDTVHPPRFDVPNYTYVASHETATTARTAATSASHTPSSMFAWHRDGFFVAGDGSKYHIVIAKTNGKPIRIARSAPLVPITEVERKSEEAGVIDAMRSVDPSWSWSGPPIPQTKAPLIELLMARDGRIWAQVPAPSERIPQDELTIDPNWKGPPPVHFRSPQIWEVYAVSGEFLGRVPLPPRARLLHADGNRVWLLERDADDLPAIVRAHIEPALPNR